MKLVKTLTLLTCIITLSACTGFQGYKKDKVVKYQCGIDTVIATYLSKDWHKIVMISVNGGAPMALSNVASNTGTRYVGGLYEILDQDENTLSKNVIAKTQQQVIQCHQVLPIKPYNLY